MRSSLLSAAPADPACILAAAWSPSPSSQHVAALLISRAYVTAMTAACLEYAVERYLFPELQSQVLAATDSAQPI